MPDEPTSGTLEEKKSDDDLNDALFNILSGNETKTFESPKKYDEPVSKENDDAFSRVLVLPKNQNLNKYHLLKNYLRRKKNRQLNLNHLFLHPQRKKSFRLFYRQR